MNERTQVVAQYFTRTSATTEVKTILQAIKNRFERHGFSNIKLFYVDNCCHEYPALVEVFDEVKDARLVAKSVRKEKLPEFDFDKDFQAVHVRVLSTLTEIKDFAQSLSALVDQARQSGVSLSIGFDAEWDMWDKMKKPLMVQIATKWKETALAAVIQLPDAIPTSIHEFAEENETVTDQPTTLIKVLICPHVHLVGNNICQDINLVDDHLACNVAAFVASAIRSEARQWYMLDSVL
jgi:hypothetical protein